MVNVRSRGGVTTNLSHDVILPFTIPSLPPQSTLIPNLTYLVSNKEK